MTLDQIFLVTAIGILFFIAGAVDLAAYSRDRKRERFISRARGEY